MFDNLQQTIQFDLDRMLHYHLLDISFSASTWSAWPPAGVTGQAPLDYTPLSGTLPPTAGSGPPVPGTVPPGTLDFTTTPSNAPIPPVLNQDDAQLVNLMLRVHSWHELIFLSQNFLRIMTSICTPDVMITPEFNVVVSGVSCAQG